MILKLLLIYISIPFKNSVMFLIIAYKLLFFKKSA